MKLHLALIILFAMNSGQAAPLVCYSKNDLQGDNKNLPEIMTEITSTYWVTTDPQRVGQGQSWYDGFEFDLSEMKFTNYYIKRLSLTSLQRSLRRVCHSPRYPKQLKVYVGGQRLTLKKVGKNLTIDAGFFGSFELKPGDRQAHLESMGKAIKNPPSVFAKN